MSKRIFISYTTRNQWVIPKLKELIMAVRPDAEIFCTAIGSVDPGENYKDIIFDSLREADVFIAIISNEYWQSKYCIVELGAAYQRHRYDPEKRIDIQPLLLPPLNKSVAMQNTPLTEIQVTNMLEPGELSAFLTQMAGQENSKQVDHLRLEIAEYVAFLKARLLTAASLTDMADVNAYYDEPQAHSVPKDSVVQTRRLAREAFQFEFNLSSLSYTPSFASMAMEYHEEINLQDYLKIDSEASFCFRLINVDDHLAADDAGVLKAVDVEFKAGPIHEVFQRVTLELIPGENLLSIPLKGIRYRPLGEINEICFVIHPKDMLKLDGTIVIDQIRVAFEEKNILAEQIGFAGTV